MPLTEASKPKVSLASISATTAAAAESLWSRSKTSSKRRQKTLPDSTITPEVSSSNPSSNPLIRTSQSQVPPPLQPQPLDRQEFRRKFIEGLQFYCENSSLILNSDLPADLIEFVTSHGFSVESLGIILELKKSSSAFSAYVDRKQATDSSGIGEPGPGSVDRRTKEQNFSEISRRLLQHWMSADSCAEAFVSLSLGEEIPGLIAECTSFQRILFAVPDNFHLVGEEFLSFLLSQLLLAIRSLVYGLRNVSQCGETTGNSNEQLNPEESIKVRTQVIATFLDRTILRYFSDAEHFYNSLNGGNLSNSFQDFVTELYHLCRGDAIARRLVSKIFLHLSAHSAAKLAKVIFSVRKQNDESLPSVLLWPAYEFLERSSQWKFILQSLPAKTVTKSKRFWVRWAEYVAKEQRYFKEFWSKSVEHWTVLNKSSLVDEHSLYSTTLAVTALAKQVRLQINDDSTMGKDQALEYIQSLDTGNVLQNVIHSLESININKRACGMALGQVVADLQFNLPISTEDSANKEPPAKMKFESKSEMFHEIINFYEDTSCEDYENVIQTSEGVDQFSKFSHKIEVLDSDDDEDDTIEGKGTAQEEDDGFPILGENDNSDTVSSEIPIDPRIMILRVRKKKIPMYFSEIVETLLERPKNEDEAEILQFIVLLKIPVLMFNGVKIDAQMASTIVKCLVDIEDGANLGVPILFGLYELFLQHPFEVANTLGEVSFGKDQYALGQRIMNLERLTQIVQLSSKQTCHNCYFSTLMKSKEEYLGVYPEFIEKYLYSRMKLRFCQACRKSGPGNLANETNPCTTSMTDTADTNEPLTWRQIVDKRVAAKTRYFFTPRSKTLITVPDDYSSKFLPILWSSIANRLTFNTAFYMSKEERLQTGKIYDQFLVKAFQYLAKCVMGSSGPNCPHIRNVAAHAGELVTSYSTYDDPIVRRTVLSLLGVTLSVGDGKTFVIEALSSQGNILQTVDQLANMEDDGENRKFIGHIQQFLASCTTNALLKFSNMDLE